MNSFTEENYIKAIYKLYEKSGSSVSTNAISEKVATKAASVTDMLKKLSAKKLINYEKYKGVTLTKKGETLALKIIRKHRLWEMFLVEILDFKWDEVHDVAEELEHINSEKLIQRIDKFLKYPKYDPHGDPIPDATGKITAPKTKRLSTYAKGDLCYMAGVVDHSPEFLQHLDSLGVTIGNQISIENIVDFDKSLEIRLNKKNKLFISHEVAKNILVLVK